MQAMWKHRRALVEPGASGRMGRLGLLNLALFQVLLPLLAPVVDLFLLYGLIFLDPYTTAALWGAVLSVQLLAAAYALRLDGERLGDVWLVPLQQIVYRQLMYLVLIQSVLTARGRLAAALAQAAPHGRAAGRAGRGDGDPLVLSHAGGGSADPDGVHDDVVEVGAVALVELAAAGDQA